MALTIFSCYLPARRAVRRGRYGTCVSREPECRIASSLTGRAAIIIITWLFRIRFPRTATFVALLALGGALLLPAEHVHYGPHGHGTLVHRHLSVDLSNSTAMHGPEDPGHVQELRASWLAGRALNFSNFVSVAVGIWELPPRLDRRAFVVADPLRIAHSPPILPRVLRGPPTFTS